jgi:hypothetical protein
MQIVQVVPKEIEILFSLPLPELKKIVEALDNSEFLLDKTVPVEKELFDTVVQFHDMLKGLLEEMAK